MTPTARVIALAAGVVLLVGCGQVYARPTPSYKALQGPFLPFAVSEANVDPTAAPRASEAPSTTPTAMPAPSATPRPRPRPTPKPAPRRTTAPVTSRISTAIIGGSATWYCCTHGYGRNEMVAAAGPALRNGDWRGRKVTVCATGGHCISVTLVDWCACGNGRIIDLQPAAFARLAPLSRGVIRVTVGLP